MMFYRVLFRLIALVDGKRVHRFAYWWTRAFCFFRGLIRGQADLPSHPVTAMGLQFPNPVGLAAGFDRDAKLADGIAHVGFGFVEIGTLNAESGADPDAGLGEAVSTLQGSSSRARRLVGPARPLRGVSLGSKRNTLDERAVADYLEGMDAVAQYADYLVINLSRPDSPGRVCDQDPFTLRTLLAQIKRHHMTVVERYERRLPLIIKVAIEHPWKNAVPATVELAGELGFDGVLAAFEYWPSQSEVNECVREISALIHPLPLIAVGGIRSVADAREALACGAALVELYSGLVEQGPARTRRMLCETCRLGAAERRAQRPGGLLPVE